VHDNLCTLILSAAAFWANHSREMNMILEDASEVIMGGEAVE
jgi:hypothetical protein